MKTLSQAITADRERLHLSQEEVANAIGVTQQALSEWEKGNTTPRAPRLRALSNYFGAESETAYVVDHIAPRGAMGAKPSNLAIMSATEHEAIGRSGRGRFPMGTQTGSGEKLPPAEDSGEPRTNSGPSSSYIASFENRQASPLTGDVHDALARAQNGVQLARQVLDDAAAQLARVLAQTPKQ